MDVLVASQHDQISDGDEETAKFSREARVSFGSYVEVINIDDSSVDRPTRRDPSQLGSHYWRLQEVLVKAEQVVQV
jgi:hypothetical protein